MSQVLIRDYLCTQGLRLPLEEVQMAYLAAQTVIQMGQAEIDRAILWYDHDGLVLAHHVVPTDVVETALKQVFMALDSVCGRMSDIQSAVVYVCSPKQEDVLVRLVQYGQVIEQQLGLNHATAEAYLASRTAQNGWLNVVDDVDYWLTHQDMVGEHHQRCQSQMSLPICLSDGKTIGVLYLESAKKSVFSAIQQQASWVALALALIEPMKVISNIPIDEKKQVA